MIDISTHRCAPARRFFSTIILSFYVVTTHRRLPYHFTTANATDANPRREDRDVCDASRDLSVQLEARVLRLFDDADALPVSMSRQRGNFVVKTKWEGSVMVTLGEAKVMKLHPEVFRPFFENFNEAFPDVNPMARSVASLEREDGKEGVKTILNFPFPLTDRIMIHWKYVMLDRNKDEHLMIFSEDGNEELLAEHFTAEEQKKYVLARTFLCAYWIQPVRDHKEEVVGSSIKYVFSGDTGGSIPRWIQNAVGPKTALDSVVGLVEYVERQREK